MEDINLIKKMMIVMINKLKTNFYLDKQIKYTNNFNCNKDNNLLK